MKKLLCMLFVCLLSINTVLGEQTTQPFNLDDAPEAIKQLHYQAMYTIVRVTLKGGGGGSGTLIYSEDRKEKGNFLTFIITNHHVVDGAIKVEKAWDSMLGTEIKKERRETVKVEVFRYERLSVVVGRESFDADIVAHSKDHDLAILKLRGNRNIEYIANLFPRLEVQNVYIGQNAPAVGCSLLHAPILTTGEITSLNDEIEDKQFWMSNSQIIYGSSGGAVFLKRDGELLWHWIGIPSRLNVIGWGTPITHMGYFVPIPRIYSWLEDQHLEFFYDKTKTPEECFEKRKKLSEKARLQSVIKATTEATGTGKYVPHSEPQNMPLED